MRLTRREYLDWKRNTVRKLVEWIPDAIREAFEVSPMVPIAGLRKIETQDVMHKALRGQLEMLRKSISDEYDETPRARRSMHRKSSERVK